MNDLTCLVTGGAGFIGSHLSMALLARGYRVLVFDDLSSGRLANLRPIASDARLIQGDVRDLDALRAACAGVDVVFHLAAISSVSRSVSDPDGTLDVNVKGTQHVFEAARLRGVRRVVFASSAAVYGATVDMPLAESAPPRPLSPYGAQKLMCEHLGAVYTHLYGLETVGLRYFNVYGPRQTTGEGAVVPRFAAALLAGEQPALFGDGQQTRDFIHVTDVARANLLAATADLASGQPSGHHIFNIGSGEATSLNKLLRVMGEVMGIEVIPHYEPERAGDIRDSLASVTRAREALGFAPEMSLRDGLADLLGARPGERTDPPHTGPNRGDEDANPPGRDHLRVM